MTSPLGPMFHGTDQDFNPGDIIRPGGNRTLREYAFASPEKDTASLFGEKLYQVEPADPEENLKVQTMPRYNDPFEKNWPENRDLKEVPSRFGFKVIKRVK